MTKLTCSLGMSFLSRLFAMNDVLINVLPVLAFFAHLLAFLTHMLGRMRLGRRLTGLGFILLACTAMVNWSLVHRLPVYSQYETCVHTALVLAACLVGLSLRNPRHEVLTWGNGILALLLGLAMPVLGIFHHDFYMYQVWPVQLFFGLRLTAGGILLIAFLLFASVWAQELKSSTHNGSDALRMAKISLILAGLVFLGSELSGSYWSLLGWGDTWHWSSNFFQSAAMFMLLMLPLHIPQGWKSVSFKAGAGSLCSLTAALAIMLP